MTKNRSIPDFEWLISTKGVMRVSNLSKISFGKNNDGMGLRVSQIGPFRITHIVDESIKYRLSIDDVQRIIKLIQKKTGINKILLGGSHSPLSFRFPSNISDIDIYLCVSKEESIDLNYIKSIDAKINKISRLKSLSTYNISASIICEEWLSLPIFYETLDPNIPTNQLYWQMKKRELLKIAEQKIYNSVLELQNNPNNPAIRWLEYISNHYGFIGKIHSTVLSPRWRGVFDSFCVPNRLITINYD